MQAAQAQLQLALQEEKGKHLAEMQAFTQQVTVWSHCCCPCGPIARHS